MTLVEYFLYAVMFLVFGVVMGYAVSRSVSYAYFRTKLEYMRRVIKDIGEDDGKI